MSTTSDEIIDSPGDQGAMALLILSHTPSEHRLYQAMHAEVAAAQTSIGRFTIRRLMQLTDSMSYSTVRRSLAGLLSKLSIEYQRVAGDERAPERRSGVYIVYGPTDILARRRAAGLLSPPGRFQNYSQSTAFRRAIERVLDTYNLSRREAEVALRCAEGLTNAQIGERLCISEQTVKFHLHHIYTKFGVKRRSELISRLLSAET